MNMKVKIALAGELPADSRLFGKMDILLEQINNHFCKATTDAEVQMLVSPSYTGAEWKNWSELHDASLCTCQMQGSTDDFSQSSQVILMETPFRSLVGESMCDQADALLVAWNEDVAELSGATWELLRIAYVNKVPCIWISTKSQKIYCLWDSYYEEYRPGYLEAVSVPLHKEEMKPSVSDTTEVPFLSFWQKRRSDYLKKYKADTSVYPAADDLLLKPDFVLEEEAAPGEISRKVLLDKFQQFDSAAICSNSKFQAIIYQRSILPFIATIFLAIGFYVETLVGTTTSLLVPDLKRVITVITLIIAGLGFLIHGALNFYAYRLSKNQQIQQWQQEYANNRFVAEILRILIHFAPYGISINIRKLCEKSPKLYTSLKHLTDDTEPSEQTVNRQSMRFVLQHMKEMLDDQLSYQTASVNRYQKIVDSLEKWGKRIMYTGLVIVIGRGALQFALVLLKAADVMNSDTISITRSFLNMLALLLPAWAGYFTTKAQQNNFRYNLNNHLNMVAKLNPIREKVIRALEQEEIPMEIINIVVMELSETMLLQDTSKWHSQYLNSSIKPL